MSQIVVAVAQAFKESLSAVEVAAAFRSAILGAGARPRVIVGSDGGDGLLEALSDAATRRTAHDVPGPLGERRVVDLAWLDSETAVLESRHACGLALVPPERRDPRLTSTRGVGVAIAAAADAGAKTVLVGLGGSATMDGGLGMARAWGWAPLDARGEPLAEGGGALTELAALRSGRPPAAHVVGLADVQAVLLGDEGAARFAAQKGATAEGCRALVAGLDRLVAACTECDAAALAAVPGAGAAGGLGFGILCFAGGTVQAGAPWVLERIGFDPRLPEAALIITGEGGFDATSLQGKLTGEVIRRARTARKPVGLVAPTARDVPRGVLVETGGGQWTAAELEGRTGALLRRALRLPPS